MSKYKELVDKYFTSYKDEVKKFSTLHAQFEEKEDVSLIDRKNFAGHFTASAFVVSKNSKEVLMIHHKALNRYLQPGGHIDNLEESPLDAAKRELFEETGIDINLLEYRCLYPSNDWVPFNISLHTIPESREKEEASHCHYDLQYLFFCENVLDVMIDKNEVNEYEWVSWNVFKAIPGFENVSRKIENISASLPE